MTKSRLGETSNEVWERIIELKDGVYSGGQVYYPILRVVCGDDFQVVGVRPNLKYMILDKSSGNFCYNLATEQQIQEFHDDLDKDRVQVLIMTKPGYQSNYKYPKVIEELHSPSGNSYKGI